MKFSKEQYDILYNFAFSKNNPGYKPNVVESPHGNGVWDEQKQYAHIAPKYLDVVNCEEKHLIVSLYEMAKTEANRVCKELGLSEDFWAGYDSTLRVLKYPKGATTAPHTDFDLFTLCMFRDQVDAFKYLGGENDPLLNKARVISPGIHFGEIITEITGAEATLHEVVGTEEIQHSIVFFVVPDHNSVLPSGLTVGEWMKERKSRSRKEV